MSRVTLSPLVDPPLLLSSPSGPSTIGDPLRPLLQPQQQRSRPSLPDIDFDTDIYHDHPFCRAYANIMGQAHPRGGVDMEVSPSTGPDPTVFRQHPRYPNVHIVSPPLSQSAPLSQSQPLQSSRTDESLARSRSRGEHTRSPPPPPISARPIPNSDGPPTTSASASLSPSQQSSFASSSASAAHRALGGLSIPIPLPRPNGFSAKPKSLARKLSRKAAPIQTKKSMGPDPFEARPFSPSQAAFDPIEILGSATVPDGQGAGDHDDSLLSGASRTVKAGTFARSVIGNKRPLEADAGLASGSVPFPVAATSLASPITA